MEAENNWDEQLSKYKIPLIMGLVGGVLLIGGVISSGIIPRTFIKSTAIPKESLVSTPLTLSVDVSGAVVKPGVYRLQTGSRVEDAIKTAGGVTEEADPGFITKQLNLAQKVADGMKIYIPMVNEAGQSAAVVAGTNTVGQAEMVNINTATIAELDTLSGIGPATAQKIIDKRPFSSIEELLIKKAVTNSVYEKIKDRVRVW